MSGEKSINVSFLLDLYAKKFLIEEYSWAKKFGVFPMFLKVLEWEVENIKFINSLKKSEWKYYHET